MLSPDLVDELRLFLECFDMRLIWIATICLIPTIAFGQQQQLGDAQVNTGGATATGGNVGGGAAGGGGQPGAGNQGAGGQSDLLNSAFGERTNLIDTGGFVGGQGGFGFIGQNPAGQQGGGQFGNTGGVQRGGNAGGNRGGQQPQRQQTVRQIRTRLVLPADFATEYRVVPAARLQSSLTTQYRKIDEVQGESRLQLGSSRVFQNANISVAASGRTVVLRGQVRSDRERRLAARIASLEPGVDRVDNQLTLLPTQ